MKIDYIFEVREGDHISDNDRRYRSLPCELVEKTHGSRSKMQMETAVVSKDALVVVVEENKTTPNICFIAKVGRPTFVVMKEYIIGQWIVYEGEDEISAISMPFI